MIGVIGINHKSAPLSIREHFAFSQDEILELLKILSAHDISEAVILSTCNRTEIYFYSAKKCFKKMIITIIEAITSYKKIKEKIDKYFYSYNSLGAVKQLLRVASGLNSMILGENQILGQIKNAYRISAENKYTGLILNRLFHKAIEAGKKVRTKTGINKGASSISYAGVELISKVFTDISEKEVLLIGAGETGELVLQSLCKRGAKKISIINRTFENAEKLAKVYRAVPFKFTDLEKCLNISDIVIAATHSSDLIITENLIKSILKRENDKKLFFIDLSVPRCIEENIKNDKNIFLYNMDDLETVVSKNYSKREKEVEKADKIINEIMNEFEVWLTTLKLRPTIEHVKEKFEKINAKEIKKFRNKVGDSEFKAINDYGDCLQKKYQQFIIKNLKSLSNNGEKTEYLEIINNLFELNKHEK